MLIEFESPRLDSDIMLCGQATKNGTIIGLNSRCVLLNALNTVERLIVCLSGAHHASWVAASTLLVLVTCLHCWIARDGDLQIVLSRGVDWTHNLLDFELLVSFRLNGHDEVLVHFAREDVSVARGESLTGNFGCWLPF